MAGDDFRKQIIGLLQAKGPCLPIQIAKQTGLDTLFAGAFLSELASEEEIKISGMKIGNSPLYFLPGQEQMLERFVRYLEKREQEACVLLKKQGVLGDAKQKPAIRVALRNLKDFAVPFRFNNQIFWKYSALPSEDARKLLGGMTALKAKPVAKPTAIAKPTANAKPIAVPKVQEQKLIMPVTAAGPVAAAKPVLAQSKQAELPAEPGRTQKVDAKKQKPKSEFAANIINSLGHGNIPILEEIDARKKEYQAVIRINSDLGPIKFFLRAKDKKLISVTDLMDTIREAQRRGMLALFLSPGELNKKSEEYAVENSGILKVKRLKQ